MSSDPAYDPVGTWCSSARLLQWIVESSQQHNTCHSNVAMQHDLLLTIHKSIMNAMIKTYPL